MTAWTRLRHAAHGIVVTNTPGTLDASVAEHVFWLLGSLVKRVPRLDAGFRAGQFAGYTGVELCGKTLGLLGFGGIARAVARIAHFGLGMRVLACGRRSPQQLEQDEGRPWAELLARWGLAEYTTDPDRICRESDAISIHLPAQVEHAAICRRPALGTAETHGLVDQHVTRQCRQQGGPARRPA